ADSAAFREGGAHNGASCRSQPFRRMYLHGHGAPGSIRRGAWGNRAAWEVGKALRGSPPKRRTLRWRDEHLFAQRSSLSLSSSPTRFPVAFSLLPIRVNSSSAFHEVSSRLCYAFGFLSICCPFFRTGRVSLLHRRIGRAAKESHLLPPIPASTSSAAFLI